MKNKLLLLAIVATLSLTGCSGNTVEEGSTASSQESVAGSTVVAESSSVEKSSAAESSKDDSNGSTFELGKTIEFEKFNVTIKSFAIVKDTDGKPVLKYTYDWTNKDTEKAMPMMTFSVTAFQDGVQTDNTPFVIEGVDLSIGQKEVKQGGAITDADGIVGITSMDKPIELELSESFSLKHDTVYTYIIDDLNALK